MLEQLHLLLEAVPEALELLLLLLAHLFAAHPQVLVLLLFTFVHLNRSLSSSEVEIHRDFRGRIGL